MVPPAAATDEVRQIIVEGAGDKPAVDDGAQAFVAPEPGAEGTVLTPEQAEAQGIDLSKVEGFKKGDDVEIRVIEVPATEAAPKVAVEQTAEEAVEADGFIADEEPVVVKKLTRRPTRLTTRSRTATRSHMATRRATRTATNAPWTLTD